MKNVLLIGDSIRIGYDKSTKKTLTDFANVVFPSDNCRFASYVLRYLHEFKSLSDNGKFDVIHWNAGLWDCARICGDEPHTPIEIYVHYIDRICKRIKTVYPEAKVIFATSTSVITERMSPNFIRYNNEIEQYNAAAVEIVKKYGFEVNDLYSVSTSLPETAHSDAVHYYTPVGTEAFTNQVVSHIAKALEIENVPTYSEVLQTDKPIGM